MNTLKQFNALEPIPKPQVPGDWDPKGFTIIVIGPNAGGSRKSRTAKYFASVAMAAGLNVQLIDADPGIGSLSASLRVERYEVNEFPTGENLNLGAALIAKARVARANLLIIDLGANEMIRGAMSRTVKALLEYAKSVGCRTYVCLSLIPFKDGLEDDADNFGNRLRRVAEIVTIYHGRENGGDFRKIDALQDVFDLSVEAPADEPAIVGLVGDRQLLPIDFAREPEPGFHKASAWVAAHLLAFAKQKAVQLILGSEAAIPELEQLAAGAPTNTYRNRTRKIEIHDTVLSAAETKILAERLLKRAGDADDDAVVTLARNYIQADKALIAAQHAATSALGDDGNH
jgi:hypothetical protein